MSKIIIKTQDEKMCGKKKHAFTHKVGHVLKPNELTSATISWPTN